MREKLLPCFAYCNWKLIKPEKYKTIKMKDENYPILFTEPT